MAKYTFPKSGSTKWHVTNELIYGIPPFALFEIDWKRNSGTCAWGKHCRGKIASVKVNAARDGFTSKFAITHSHRGKRSALLSGIMNISVDDSDGNVDMKISGMTDWRDNTTFEALRVKGGFPKAPVAGKNFEVTLVTGASGKAGVSASYGNLYVKDLDRKVEMTYPLLVVGSGLSAGITIAASTTFNKVKLPFPCRYWDGALVEMYTAGTTVIVGSTETQLRFRLTNGQRFSMKSSGFGVNLDVSINWGTMQIGSLGPKTREVAY